MNIDEEKLYQAYYEPDVASRYKVARLLRTTKSSEVPFLLEAIYRKTF